MAYIFILALFFFTISAQQTSWTGEGGSGNNTASNPLNWSNGVPTATSIVYLNDTSCTGTSCTTIIWDFDGAVAAIYQNGTYSKPVNIQVSGSTLTVTGWFVQGNPWAETGSRVEIIGGGAFEIGADCVATIYPNYYDLPIYGNDAGENWFINSGTVNIAGNDLTTASYDTINIGTSGSSGVNLYVDSVGTWEVTGSNVLLRLSYISAFNIKGGSIKGTWIDAATVSILFYGSNVILQDGAGGDATGAGKVTFEYVEFGSYYTQSSSYSDPPPSAVIFNTTGVTISSSQFNNNINILFLFEGWLENCNVTGSAMVNSSSSVSGVIAHFVGDSNFIDGGIFAGIGTDFIVKVDKDAYVTMLNTFYLYGSVTLIIAGTWEYNSGSDLYWDHDAYWVNLGLITVVRASNDYIRASTFPSISPPTAEVGTMVNFGTIEFVSGGGLYFYDGTGTFYQGKNGIMKFEYGNSDSGNVQFAEVILYGWVGVYFSKDYVFTSSGDSFFTWKTPADKLPEGDIKFIANGPDFLGLDISAKFIVCFSPSSLNSKIYDLTEIDSLLCPADSKRDLNDNGSDNYVLPDRISALEDDAVCPANADPPCGSIDAGSVPKDGTSACNVNVASLAFIVSLICLLFKF